MSYEIEFTGGSGGDVGFYFGSGTDVEEFDEWVTNTLPKKYTKLKKFVANRTVKNTRALRLELESAVADFVPDKGLGMTIEEFLECIGDGETQEVARLSDGVN